MYFLWRKLQTCDMISQCLFSEEKISSPLLHSHEAPEFSVLIGYCSVHSLRSIGLRWNSFRTACGCEWSCGSVVLRCSTVVLLCCFFVVETYPALWWSCLRKLSRAHTKKLYRFCPRSLEVGPWCFMFSDKTFDAEGMAYVTHCFLSSRVDLCA